MRTLLITTFIILLTIGISAQDHILSGLYSQDQIALLKNENPEVIKYWKMYVNRGWLITVAKDDISYHGQINASIEKFNPIDHHIYPANETQYFEIVGTNKTLIVHPKEHLQRLYNKSLEQ